MSDDEKYREGFGDEPAVESSNEEVVEEEQKAQEEFVSKPEDEIDDDDEDRLKGAIGSGNLEADYPDEKAKDAPAEEAPTEAAEPAPVVDTPVVAAPVAEDAKPKKKSKKGLIITLIVLAFLLIGLGVAAIIFISIYESPEVSVRDAIMNFWKADYVQANGDISIKQDNTDATITLDALKAGANISGSGKIQAEYNGKDVEVGYSASYIEGGKAYFKLDGLDGLEDVIDYNSMSESSDGLDLSGILEDLLGTLVEKVDNQWYKITIDDTKDLKIDSLTCFMENLDDVLGADAKDGIANAYKEHPFVKLEDDTKASDQDGARYYTVKFDKDEQKAFGEAVGDMEALKKITSCSESQKGEDAISTQPFEGEEEDEGDSGITNDDVKEEDESETVFRIGVKPWTHELAGLEATTDSGKNSNKMSIKFSYDKKDVSEPSDAKDFSELLKTVQESIKESFGAMIESYADQYCKSYSTSLSEIELCKQSMIQSLGSMFGDLDISTLLNNFGGGDPINL